MIIEMPPVYKIRDTKTGLWECKGEDARFTKRGKVWSSRGAVLNHLLQYLDRDYHSHRSERNSNWSEYSYINKIGESWEVVELTAAGVKTFPAREFVKQAPKWKKWEEARCKGPQPPPQRCEVPCPTCKGRGKI